MELFVRRGSAQRWRPGESRVLCSVWDAGGRGQTQRKLEDVRKKQVRKGGPRVRARCGTQARAGCTCAGRRLAPGGWPPWRGGRRCSCRSPARGVGAGGSGARCRRAGQSPGAPARSVCAAQAVGRARVGVGSPGGKPEGSPLRPVPPRHPATAGRSSRAEGPRGERPYWHRHGEPGAAWGGALPGVGVRTSQVRARGDPGGPRGAGGGVCGASFPPTGRPLISLSRGWRRRGGRVSVPWHNLVQFTKVRK